MWNKWEPFFDQNGSRSMRKRLKIKLFDYVAVTVISDICTFYLKNKLYLNIYLLVSFISTITNKMLIQLIIITLHKLSPVLYLSKAFYSVITLIRFIYKRYVVWPSYTKNNNILWNSVNSFLIAIYLICSIRVDNQLLYFLKLLIDHAIRVKWP